MWRKRQRESPGPGRRDVSFLIRWYKPCGWQGPRRLDSESSRQGGAQASAETPPSTVHCVHGRPRLHGSKWDAVPTALHYQSGGARLDCRSRFAPPFQVWVTDLRIAPHWLCYFNISPSSTSTFTFLFIKTVIGLQIDSFPLFRRKILPLKNLYKNI